MAITLDGRAESAAMLKRLAAKVAASRRPITLATILVGNRYDSALYVRLKRQAAAKVGIKTEYHHLPAKATQRRLEAVIKRLNRKKSIHGMLLQLPLPKHLDADRAIAVMDPHKDVDGFHPNNTWITPPPIAAVRRLIAMGQPRPGSLVVIVAQPSVFATQLAHDLDQAGYFAAIVPPHPKISAVTQKADVIVTALGNGPRLRSVDIAAGAIIVDVGIRKLGPRTVGDVEPSAWKKAKAVSPVPGGVGPMTIAYVLANTYQLAKRS